MPAEGVGPVGLSAKLSSFLKASLNIQPGLVVKKGHGINPKVNSTPSFTLTHSHTHHINPSENQQVCVLRYLFSKCVGPVLMNVQFCRANVEPEFILLPYLNRTDLHLSILFINAAQPQKLRT